MSAPIFSTPAIHSRTSSIFVAAVTGSLTALSYAGHPLWQCTLGSQVFAPLCCLPASSSATVQRQQLLASSNRRAEPCSARDHLSQASMTNWEAAAAAAAAPHAAAAATTATAATIESKEEHGLTCVRAGGFGAADAPDDGARGGDGDMVLIGTSSGTLHCISCSSGYQLWQIQTGGSISTAAGFCPAGTAPSDAPADVGTDALADLVSHKSAATHKQMKTDAQTDAQTDSKADAQAESQHQQQSFTRQQTQIEMAFDRLLVSCTNSGAVRVLSLPAVTGPKASLDHELLQSGQRAARPDEEVPQSPIPRRWAAAQMPGECMFC